MSQIAYRKFPCNSCGAEVGEHCVTYDGRPTSNAHVDRVVQENAAWMRAHPDFFERDRARPGELAARYGL